MNACITEINTVIFFVFFQDEPFISTEIIGNKLRSSHQNNLVMDFATDNTVCINYIIFM